MKERLQKILARAGVCSRRHAEKLILEGRVAVDGTPVTVLGAKADPETQEIRVDGRPVAVSEQKVYILLNKPRGYVTTVHDPQGRPKVTDLVPGSVRLFPVGRLDLDTEGALLLTNDGDLAQRILHPRNKVPKTYVAVVRGHPSRDGLNTLRQGIEIDGRRTAPARITFLGRSTATSRFQVTIHEGRKRQIRKMFDAIGHPVVRLRRIAYGGLKMGRLAPGEFRHLTPRDLEAIFSAS